MLMLTFTRKHSGMANSLDASLSILPGILSGPVAFDVFNDLSSFSIDDGVLG